ncbi:DUF3306 domain-containing protein [Roseibium aggregatum]|uniref:DUF3306 domain-containing protein n=1 Tax=Roseibium aggregatum TaxID=187304 RepID=A0A926S7A1_9HYPH|nr:DUF3306 domain-containing protein [Roseibium aggregatum]MBD1549428.1 DUF3306 domain-containing protein [Roseibium aggregatum]
MGNEKEGVLGRWSRRKRAAAVAEEHDTELLEDAVSVSAPAELPPEPTGEDMSAAAAEDLAHEETVSATDEGRASADGERMLSEEDLPDIDSLSYGSDFSAFLQKNVPEHLHRMALRKLWTSNPVLANVDGLNDYDLDYTISEMKEIAAQSAEDLARGAKRLNVSDLRSREREARRQAAAQARPGPAQATAPAPAPIAETQDDGREGAAASEQIDPFEGGEAVTPPPRRTDA